MRREKENMNKRKERIRAVQSLRKASDRGITLIALVITILIIIILATVTINFAFGDDGLINMAEEARDQAINSTDYESDARTNLVAFMNEFIAGETGGSSAGNETEEPTPEPEPEPEVIPVTGISINPTLIESNYTGMPQTFNMQDIEVTIEPSNATNKNYKWYFTSEPIEEEAGGILVTVENMGNYTLRVVSDDNPNIYAELTIRINRPTSGL